MIEILKISQGQIHVLDKPEPGCWINASNPNVEEIIILRSFLEIPEDLLTSLKDIDEIPTMEEYEKFTFLIIRAPFNIVDNEREYISVPLGIFIAKEFVMTVYYHENDALPKLKSQKIDVQNMQLVFKILLVTARLFLTYLSEINKKMYALEAQLERSQKNKIIMEFLDIEKSLVFFKTALKSNEILIEAIAREKTLVKTPEDKRMIAKVADENKQAIEMTVTYLSILGETLDAFASIISNNLSVVMKTLAVLTIIVAIPTMVASVYGMNILTPFRDSPHAFLIVSGAAVTLTLLAVFFFWRKKFF